MHMNKINFFIILITLASLLISCGKAKPGTYEHIENAILFHHIETTNIKIPHNENLKSISAKDGSIVYSTTLNGGFSEQFYYHNINNHSNEAFYSLGTINNAVLDFQAANGGFAYFLVLESNNESEDIYIKRVKYSSTNPPSAPENIMWMNDFFYEGYDDCYRWNITISPSQNILVFSPYGFRYLTREGTLLSEERWEHERFFDMILLRDDLAFIQEYQNGKRVLSTLDLANNETVTLYNMHKYLALEYIVTPEENLLIRTESKLLEYDFSKSQLTELWRWSDYGITGDKIRTIFFDGNGLFSCVTDDTDSIIITTWQGVEAENQRTEIILGCMNEQTHLRNAVVKFNMENPDYIIKVVDYWSHDDEIMKNNLNVLYNDIIAGKGPDIIELNSNYIDYMVLSERGTLVDLLPYIYSSNVINKDDFVASIFSALKSDKNLYILPTNFAVSTLITNNPLIKSRDQWTINMIRHMINENPDLAIDFMGKDIILWCLTTYALSFDDKLLNTKDTIRNYLEFANLLPDNAMFDGSYSKRKEGKILFDIFNFSNIQDYQFKKSIWGTNSLLIGYPDTSGNGASFIPLNSFGINSKSTNKDISWEFIEKFFTNDWQENITPNWHFSILSSTLEKQFINSMSIQTYIDENGNEKEVPILSYLSDDLSHYIDVYAAKESDIAEIRQLINETKTIRQIKPDLLNIISEEAAFYFSGQKSIDDVMDIIENRIVREKIYW